MGNDLRIPYRRGVESFKSRVHHGFQILKLSSENNVKIGQIENLVTKRGMLLGRFERSTLSIERQATVGMDALIWRRFSFRQGFFLASVA